VGPSERQSERKEKGGCEKKRPKDTTAQYSKHSSSTLEIKVDVRRILEAVGWSFVCLFFSFRRSFTWPFSLHK
jgi:hypothetical protein